MATPSPVNWRAVRAAVGLALIFDAILVFFGVSAAAIHAHRLPMVTGSALPKAPPAAVCFKRRDTRSDEELARQLLDAPELDLGADPATGAPFLATTRRGNSRFTEPLLDTLLARADLQGLPVAMGSDCRLDRESASVLKFQSRELRRLLSECLVAEAPNAVLLRPRLLPRDEGTRRRDESVPALAQMLQAEEQPVRLLLVELLARTLGRRASSALAGRAVFDLSAEVREAAVRALADRPRDEYRGSLLDGLRYPWAPAADHAAEALVALDERESLPALKALLDEPDPAQPVPRTFHDIDPELVRRVPWPREAFPAIAVVLDKGKGGERRTGLLPYPSDVPGRAEALTGSVTVVRELVRVNHHRNCLLCHASVEPPSDALLGQVPSPDRPLPPPFSTRYDGSSCIFVRADITYLRQDFSVSQPLPNPGKWPVRQRYDYVVRTRYPTADEMRRQTPETYPQREAVRWALHELGAKDG